MKLIHIPFCFYPDPVGGTEIYVAALAHQQQRSGDEVIVAAPGDEDQTYKHDGLTVRRFSVSPRVSHLREMYGDGSPDAAASFARILDQERPDLVHLHAFTRAVSLRLLREAKQREIPVVFSYLTPTASCLRGTLLRWGSEVCDGLLDTHRCARCVLHGQGLAKPASVMLGSLSPKTGAFLGGLGASGGLWTALRMTELVALRQAAFRGLMNEADHIVALCDWVKDLLLRNGAPAAKLSVSRLGLCQAPTAAPRQERVAASGLRVAFLGRLDPTKGVHVLIEALRRIPAAAIQLDVYGVAQGDSGRSYGNRLAQLAGGDSRIAFRAPVKSGEIVPLLHAYDVLAVPSQWLETGPLVVMEAFAAGIPVIGSNLGGIAELVQHGVNGVLVDAASAPDWAEALRRLSTSRDLIAALRSGIKAPRTMVDTAADLMVIYRQLVPAHASVFTS
jgi:glycosyltransferase involved in cell wall biosynthesis